MIHALPLLVLVAIGASLTPGAVERVIGVFESDLPFDVAGLSEEDEMRMTLVVLDVVEDEPYLDDLPAVVAAPAKSVEKKLAPVAPQGKTAGAAKGTSVAKAAPAAATRKSGSAAKPPRSEAQGLAKAAVEPRVKGPVRLRLVPTIPARPADAATGSVLMQRLAALDAGTRERLIVREILSGNVPQFLRKLATVRLSHGGSEAIVRVMPDYLAVGSDTDFVRVSLSLPAATRIARELGFVLPTTRIVDAIHRQAAVKVRPVTLPPIQSMASVGYLLRHEELVRATLGGGHPTGALTSGMKKDLVLSNKLARRRDRVAIYGWHRADAKPIQPLSDVHGKMYADYSHGVRLVSATVEIDGVRRSIYDVLADPAHAALLSDEGELKDAKRQMAH